MTGNMPGARWVPGEQLHLTLRFIGDADDQSFRLIRAALATIKGRPFPLALEKVGHFPPSRQPRVVWVGMDESRPLLELQAQVESSLQKAGVPPDDRKFSPHITIARLKDTPAPAVAAFEDTTPQPSAPEPFRFRNGISIPAPSPAPVPSIPAKPPTSLGKPESAIFRQKRQPDRLPFL